MVPRPAISELLFTARAQNTPDATARIGEFRALLADLSAQAFQWYKGVFSKGNLAAMPSRVGSGQVGVAAGPLRRRLCGFAPPLVGLMWLLSQSYPRIRGVPSAFGAAGA